MADILPLSRKRTSKGLLALRADRAVSAAPTISAITAMTSPDLLAEHFSGPSWSTWRAILKAAEGLPLTPSELAAFRAIAERDPPGRRVRELWVLGGRRSGKDSVASLIATAMALGDYKKHLRAGERASVLCLAVSREQARIVHRYISAYFTENAILKPLLIRETEDTLELSNNVEIIIATNNYRSLRGRSFLCVILDEISFFRSEDSANPDHEVYQAILPGMVTIPGSMLVGITSVYRKAGLAYDKWRKHYGQDDPDILVVKGPSTAFNPTLPQSIIDAALERDPEAASAEWLSEWRNDISGFLDRELIEQCVEFNTHVRAPQQRFKYVAFSDPSGGRGDSFTCAIAHAEEQNVAVLDAIYERRAPFDPQSVVAEIAEFLRSYRVSETVGDKYAAEWVTTAFRRERITYKSSERDRSALYLDALPLFSSGRAKLIHNERLIHQLANLERRTTRLGKDIVDHGPQGQDDVANAAAGALVLCQNARRAPYISPEMMAKAADPHRPRLQNLRAARSMQIARKYNGHL